MPVYPLTAPVPLRTSAAWPRYSHLSPLQHVYGRALVPCIRYDRNGYLFHVADHVCVSVDRVYRDGREEAAWRWFVDTDSTGHACTWVELFGQLQDGETLSAWVRGKPHPVTGLLMTNPATVVWDLLQLARRDVNESDLDAFRWEGRNIEIGGAVYDHTRPAKDYLSEIASSIGAVWGGGMAGFMRLYPHRISTDEYLWNRYDRFNIDTITVSARKEDLVTALRVRYAWDFANGTARQVLDLEATDPAREYGRILKEIDLKWVTSPHLAYAVGVRYLEFMSRPRWSIDWRSRRRTPPGGYCRIEHPILPVSGETMCLSSVRNPLRKSASHSCEIPVGDAPDISLVQTSEAFEPAVRETNEVIIRDNTVAVVLKDATGAVQAGKWVIIDGSTRKMTDANGRVSIPAGTHTIVIEETGQSQTIKI